MKNLKRRAAKEPPRKQKTVLQMRVKPAIDTNAHAQLIASHRKQLDEIHGAYRESIAAVFSDPGSLAEKQSLARKNIRQFAKALGDWHCAALEILAEGQEAALLRMLPDFKDGRWLN